MNLSVAGIGVSALALVALVVAAGQASRLRNDLHGLDERVKAIEGTHTTAGPAPKAANSEDADRLRDDMARLQALLAGLKEAEDKMGGTGNPSGLTMVDLRTAVEAALADRDRQARAEKSVQAAVKATEHNAKALAKAAKEWNLTPEQTGQIRAILAEQVESYKGIWTAEKGTPDKTREVNDEVEKKIQAVLTEDQKGVFRGKPMELFMKTPGPGREK